MKIDRVLHDIWIVTTDKGKYLGMIREYKNGELVVIKDGQIVDEIGKAEEAKQHFNLLAH